MNEEIDIVRRNAGHLDSKVVEALQRANDIDSLLYEAEPGEIPNVAGSGFEVLCAVMRIATQARDQVIGYAKTFSNIPEVERSKSLAPLVLELIHREQLSGQTVEETAQKMYEICDKAKGPGEDWDALAREIGQLIRRAAGAISFEADSLRLIVDGHAPPPREIH